MFVAEAKILGMLNHPNVVQAYDFGEADGTLFLVLEYADGPSLDRALKALPVLGRLMPIAIAAHFAHEVCRALDYVHRLRERRRADARRSPRRHAVEHRAHVGRRAQAAGLRRRALQRVAAFSEHGAIRGKAAYLAPEALGAIRSTGASTSSRSASCCTRC